MDWSNIHTILSYIQHAVSVIGILIIVAGVLLALGQFLYYLCLGQLLNQDARINTIRLDLGRVLILGLEFIVAADLIGTTTTPGYYEVGVLAIIVLIRTLLTYSLSREMAELSK